METNKAVITSDTIKERRGLTDIKKFFKIFIKQSKSASRELIEIQYSDDEPFKTGEEMLQYAKKIESKLQPMNCHNSLNNGCNL